MELGTRIAALRRKQGMTQEQLAQYMGTTRQAVSKWESGKSEPDVSALIRLGELFQVTMDYLLLGKEAPAQEPPEKENRKRWFIPCMVILVIGIAILLLLPLFASLYQSQAPYPKHTDANVYLTEWPMLGVVLVGLLIIGAGIGGLAWVFPEKARKIIGDYLTP